MQTTTRERVPFFTTMVSMRGALATVKRIRKGGEKGYKGEYEYHIQMRKYTKYDKDGKQIHGCRKSRYLNWQPYNELKSNLKDAIRAANVWMLRTHQGFVVYLRLFYNGIPTRNMEKLYEAKWGTDGKPFRRLTPACKALLYKKV